MKFFFDLISRYLIDTWSVHCFRVSFHYLQIRQMIQFSKFELKSVHTCWLSYCNFNGYCQEVTFEFFLKINQRLIPRLRALNIRSVQKRFMKFYSFKNLLLFHAISSTDKRIQDKKIIIKKSPNCVYLHQAYAKFFVDHLHSQPFR